jgi:hypothetical protein
MLSQMVSYVILNFLIQLYLQHLKPFANTLCNYNIPENMVINLFAYLL